MILWNTAVKEANTAFWAECPEFVWLLRHNVGEAYISRSLPAKRSFLTLQYLILTLRSVNFISVYSRVRSVNVIDLASTSGYQSNAV